MPNIFKMNIQNAQPGAGFGQAIEAIASSGMREKQAQIEAEKLFSAIEAQKMAGEKSFEEARDLRLTNDYRDGTRNALAELMQDPNYQNSPKFEQAANLAYRLLGKGMKSYTDSLESSQGIYDRETIKRDPRTAARINQAYFAVKGADPRMKLGEDDRVSSLFGNQPADLRGNPIQVMPSQYATGNQGQGVNVRGQAQGVMPGSPITYQTPSSKKGVGARRMAIALDEVEKNLNNLYSADGIASKNDDFTIGDAFQSSIVGQLLGSAFRTDNQGYRDAIDMKRSGMVGDYMTAAALPASQGNSDKEGERLLKGIVDPSLPYEVNMENLDAFRQKFNIPRSGHPATSRLKKRPKAGDVVNGYEYIGGTGKEENKRRDESGDPNNWVFVGGAVPNGVDPEDWKFMPEDLKNKLWNKR